MNKSEKLIVMLLGLALVWWMWQSIGDQKKSAETQARQAAARASQPKAVKDVKGVKDAKDVKEPKDAKDVKDLKETKAVPRAPEQLATLKNGQLELTFSSHGAVIKKARMLQYAERPGAISDSNPSVSLDLSASPALALSGVPGLDADADYIVAESREDSVVFTNAFLRREVSLKDDYRIEVAETFAPGCPLDAATALSLGSMSLGSSKNDILSIDSWIVADEKGKSHVEHHGDDGPLKSYLAGGFGGCSGSSDASAMPPRQKVAIPGARSWLAVKNRFFVTALTGLTGDAGFVATIDRDMSRREYVPKSVAAAMMSSALPESRARSYVLYLGPKKQKLLWNLGLKDVMEFGMWRWLCYPMVWVLNFFNSLIPNYGVAIILMTILVRLLFWPLTHKSTVGMRKMQEIQPKLKEIQAKFKDNPQRMQQETWQLYRDHKVNPLSSCLPMLVQIPVFIALFNVLRSTVELRYAPFLWISDLSEPEALFASWFPFGGLNILPLFMTGLTILQSAFTPTSGDKNQQRMMMIMMPLFMLVMFYNFPSALSLYWALSTAFGVVQAWWIRKKYTPVHANDGVVVPDSVEMPVTRQMRRHGKGEG